MQKRVSINVEAILRPKLERYIHLPSVEKDRKLSSSVLMAIAIHNLEKHFKKTEQGSLFEKILFPAAIAEDAGVEEI